MNIDNNNIDPKLLEEDDRIEAYLKGLMSAEDEQKFFKELEDNPELKEKAISMARLVKGLKEVGSEQDSVIQRVILASNKQDVEAATKNATYVPAAASKTPIISLSKTAKWLSIAASLIFIVWLGLTYNSYRNTTGLGNQFGNVIENVPRGQETEAERKLQELFSDVQKNINIDEAIHKLSLYWELSMMDTPNDYSNHSSEIGWNLAIAHLKNNDKKDAKAVLEKLIPISDKESKENEKARLINEKAKELMEKL